MGSHTEKERYNPHNFALGNSLGVLLPKAAFEAANLQEGDRLEVETKDGQIVMGKANRPSLDELLARITPENRHAEIFSIPFGNEVW